MRRVIKPRTGINESAVRSKKYAFNESAVRLKNDLPKLGYQYINDSIMGLSTGDSFAGIFVELENENATVYLKADYYEEDDYDKLTQLLKAADYQLQSQSGTQEDWVFSPTEIVTESKKTNAKTTAQKLLESRVSKKPKVKSLTEQLKTLNARVRN